MQAHLAEHHVQWAGQANPLAGFLHHPDCLALPVTALGMAVEDDGSNRGPSTGGAGPCPGLQGGRWRVPLFHFQTPVEVGSVVDMYLALGAVLLEAQDRVETPAHFGLLNVPRYSEGEAQQVTVGVLVADEGQGQKGEMGILGRPPIGSVAADPLRDRFGTVLDHCVSQFLGEHQRALQPQPSALRPAQRQQAVVKDAVGRRWRAIRLHLGVGHPL